MAFDNSNGNYHIKWSWINFCITPKCFLKYLSMSTSQTFVFRLACIETFIFSWIMPVKL